MPRSLAPLYIALLLTTTLTACGDDSSGPAGSGGTAGTAATGGTGAMGGAGGTPAPSCPTIAAAWVIEEHCLDGFATEVIPFDQTGCNVVVSGAFSGLEGTLDDNGNIDLDGALGVMPYACAGTFDETEMLLTCNSDCPVRLVPQ